MIIYITWFALTFLQSPSPLLLHIMPYEVLLCNACDDNIGDELLLPE